MKTIAQLFAGEIVKAAICVANRETKKLNKKQSGDRYVIPSVHTGKNLGVIIRHGKYEWEGVRFADGAKVSDKTRAKVYAKLFIM